MRILLLLCALLVPSAACGGGGGGPTDGDTGSSDASTPATDAGDGDTGEAGIPVLDGGGSDARPGDGGSGDDAGGGDGGGSTSFTPYHHDGFEEYSEGDKPTGGFSRTEATTEQAYRGEQSARMAIEPDDGGGFGNWGLCEGIDPAVEKGGEVWVRVYVYWPESFEFSASPFMKFLRLHNADGEGSNDGYNDLYVDNADDTEGVLRCIKEVHNVWEIYDGPPLPRDTWERYEMYLSVDDVPVDEGGEGRMRIWRDDELIFDRTDVPTIETPDGTIDLFYLFTYWNNEMPPSNHCYVDDLTIATDASPPPNRDAAGNVYIGDWQP